MQNSTCPNCGHPIVPGSKFCEKCGYNLTVKKSPEVNIPPVQPSAAQQTPVQQSTVQPAPVKKIPKEKKSHLGLVLGITIPVIVIGILIILFLAGVFQIPFLSSGKQLAGTWYQFAATTPEKGLCSLQDLANLQDKEPNDIRLTMTCNKDGSGQMTGGEKGVMTLSWSEDDNRYTITCDGQIYTGNFETDDQFVMTGSDNIKLHFSQNINHQIPNQIEVTPSPSPSPTPTPQPTIEPYYTTPTEEPLAGTEDNDIGMGDDTEDMSSTDSEYIFPNSDSEYLTKDDIAGMSKSEINLAKNELYARHGRKFKSKELQEYFDSKSWYYGIYSPKQWDKKGDKYFFNKYEIKNRNLLKKHE